MVAVNSTSAYAYQSYSAYGAPAAKTSQSAPQQKPVADHATEVTLSDEAKAALADRDFATVLNDARNKLDKLLVDAGRTSPMQGGKLSN